LEDYASNGTIKIGENMISRDIENVPNEKTKAF
jgi:hypothetical protein